MILSYKISQLLSHYFILCILYIAFFILLSIAKVYLPDAFNQEYEQSILLELLKEKSLQLFILVVVLAPIIEEMMFRTLIKPSHNDLMSFLSSWIVYYLNTLIPNDVHWVIKIGFVLILLFALFYIIKHLIIEKRTVRIRAFLEKHYITFLIASSLFFGLIHINNYVNSFIINVTLISLIIPRILSGFMMGFTKVKNEHLLWSISLHAINNGIAIGVMILIQNITTFYN